jgi:putative acetyltransferase
MDALNRLEIRRLDPKSPDLRALLDDHAAHSATHYPADSNHHLDASGLAASRARLFGGWLDGRLVAMGAYVPFGETEAEVKSMHVHVDARGQGAGQAVLAAIMQAARSEGIHRLWLETGSRTASAAARMLYRRAGFEETEAFGDYRPDPESVFMMRAL